MDVRVISVMWRKWGLPTNDDEHCTFGGYHKKSSFLFYGHNLAKSHKRTITQKSLT